MLVGVGILLLEVEVVKEDELVQLTVGRLHQMEVVAADELLQKKLEDNVHKGHAHWHRSRFITKCEAPIKPLQFSDLVLNVAYPDITAVSRSGA
jgi:hypothetical protein